MKNLRSILLAVTVLLLATAPQAQTTNVKAAIPFDFVVDDHAYPAGEYTVKSPSQGSAAIRIDNADESEKGVILSNACSKARPAVGTTLVFQRLVVDSQLAAPAETRTPTCTERQSLNKECGWNGGDRGGLTGWEQFGKRRNK